MTNDKHRMTDEQLGKELESLISGNVESVTPPAGTFLAIQDRLGSQDPDWSPSRLIKKLVPGEWRLPMFTGMFVKAGAAVIVAIAIAAVLVFQGRDDDSGTQQAAEPTATVVTVPEATPIAKLMVPDDLVPFGESGGWPMHFRWHADQMKELDGSLSGVASLMAPYNASDEQVATLMQQQIRQEAFGRKRMLLLIYAPGVDPFTNGDVFEYDQAMMQHLTLGRNKGVFTVSADDPKVIIVEEFAFCDDGRGVYLQHSEKPVEIGETFGWDVYVLPEEANDGIFHLVMTAEPDSPITHDGPDPKRLDMQITTYENVLTAYVAEADIKLVGLLAHDPAIPEMCAN